MRALIVIAMIVCASVLAHASDRPRVALQWGTFGSGDGEFYFPQGIAVDSSGTVYVADTGNNRIQRFSSSGQFLSKWGSAGTGDGQFNSPRALAIGPGGMVYVLDFLNRRVQKFTGDGTFLMKWGSAGSADGQFVSPDGIAVGLFGDIYVSDASLNRVQKFSNGVFVTKWGATGSLDGQFQGCRGLTVSGDGSVHVIDAGNNRIQRFTANGTFISKWYGPPDDFFALNIAAGASGVLHLMVAATGNFHLQDFTLDGNPLVSYAFAIDRIAGPAVDRAGNLYAGFWEPGNVDRPPVSYARKLEYVHRIVIQSDAASPDLRLCAPQGEGTQLQLDAAIGYATSSGITGAEFRIEVANPTGWFFSYTPPPDAFVVGTPFDMAPNDPNNASGITLNFSTCQPADHPPTAGDRVGLGIVTAYNINGAPTELRIRPKSPGMPCVRFFLCDAPFFTPACTSPEPGSDVLFRTVLNDFVCSPSTAAPGQPANLSAALQGTTPESMLLQWQQPTSGGQAAYYNIERQLNGGPFERINTAAILGTSFVDNDLLGATYCYRVMAANMLDQAGPSSSEACVHYVPVFATQTLLLDTREVANDGAAGPVATSTVMDQGLSFLVTVSGTASLWPAASWQSPPNVLCGRPEQAPQMPSPGATNYWVGVDAERVFSQPLPSGGDCTLLDPADANHGRFEIDLGGGFAPVEPLGGIPSNPSPGHVYKYLLQGNLNVARFRWIDDSTHDNYGVFTILVEQVVASNTDAPRFPPSITVLPAIPNPFNPSTRVRYLLPAQSLVEASISDPRGRLVRRLYHGIQNAGPQSILWDGRLDSGASAPSGIYYVRIHTLGGDGIVKLTLVR